MSISCDAMIWNVILRLYLNHEIQNVKLRPPQTIQWNFYIAQLLEQTQNRYYKCSVVSHPTTGPQQYLEANKQTDKRRESQVVVLIVNV